LRENAKFCDECGTAIATPKSAEYKQVTVLFADVVHSMDIAAAVGPERLREIMAEVFNGSAAIVQRYAGTVDKFTGDGGACQSCRRHPTSADPWLRTYCRPRIWRHRPRRTGLTVRILKAEPRTRD
jgi:hypothetical protein